MNIKRPLEGVDGSQEIRIPADEATKDFIQHKLVEFGHTSTFNSMVVRLSALMTADEASAKDHDAMPNTLAHFGVQGLITRSAIPGADLKWIYLACVLPDVPWIILRIVRLAAPGSWFIDLQLYGIVQSTLLFCCLLSGALAVWSSRPGRTFGVLALGSALHLLIDATQTKLANGVLLFAPISWELLNFGLYWPEEAPTLVLTVFGLAFVLLMLWKVPIHYKDLRIPPTRHFAVGAFCLILYFIAPPFLFYGPQAADNHSIRTLRDVEARSGKAFEVDRRPLMVLENKKILIPFTGEELVVSGYMGDASGIVSAKGVFLDPSTVRLDYVQLHAGRLRDLPSYLGIGLLSMIWLWAIYARLRPRDRGNAHPS